MVLEHESHLPSFHPEMTLSRLTTGTTHSFACGAGNFLQHIALLDQTIGSNADAPAMQHLILPLTAVRSLTQRGPSGIVVCCPGSECSCHACCSDLSVVTADKPCPNNRRWCRCAMARSRTCAPASTPCSFWRGGAPTCGCRMWRGQLWGRRTSPAVPSLCGSAFSPCLCVPFIPCMFAGHGELTACRKARSGSFLCSAYMQLCLVRQTDPACNALPLQHGVLAASVFSVRAC